MTRRQNIPALIAASGLLLLLGACTAAQKTPTQPVELTMSVSETSTASLSENTPVNSPNAGETPSLSTDPANSPTAARATLTPLPYDWKDAPIMPEISPHVLEIYQEGQRQGRDPHAFSVIGDCQAVPVVFMGPYELGQFAPPSNEAQLWDVIHYFKGSFARWGAGVRGGFTAASLLAPLQADPSICKSGETPLTCEYRIHNPAFVFITLETWLEPKTVDRYDGYLRKIMDYVISKGTVPILMTKADSSEMRNGTHVFNPIIIQVAHDYDVPVINFFRAAQYLDNSGIDPKREGFHLSQAGYDLKNTLALRTLYSTWKMVTQGGEGSAQESGTATPTAAPTVAAAAGPVVTTPECKGGCIFYATIGSQDGTANFQGVFAYNYEAKTQTQVLPKGYNLQDVSNDGKRLLVNDGRNLYEVTLADGAAKLVSQTFYSMGRQGAYWNSDDTSVVYIDQDHPLKGGDGTAFNLFPSPLNGETYFESGACSSLDFCQSKGVYKSNSDQSVTAQNEISKPVFSDDGKWMAYLNPAAATSLNYFHINYLLLQDPQKGIGTRRVFYLPDDHIWMRYPDVRDVAFSPDGKRMFIILDVYSEYFENSLRIETYSIDVDTGRLYDYGKMSGQMGSYKPRLVWSPDSHRIMFFLTGQAADGKYSLSLFETTMGGEERLKPYAENIYESSDYFYISNLFWR